MILEQSSSLKVEIKIRRLRKAKIIATLGPATSTPAAIKALLVAGVDVFRFNFIHGTHEIHAANYRTVRQLESEFNRPIAILADLQGPKIRIGKFIGYSVIRAARERPKAPILSISPNISTSRFLSLVWGVHSVQSADPSDSEDICEQAVSFAKREGMTQPEQPIVVLAGMPFGQSGTTNTLRVAWP